MRTLSHDNKPGPGKHWYLWHPDDLNNATPMDEVTWFVVYQPLLLKVVNCLPGRDLLRIPADLPRIERMTKNSIHWRTGVAGQWQSRFYVGAKYANAIRHQWPAFKRLAKTFYERQVYGRTILEPVLNVGGQLVAAHATDTFYPDPDPETTTVDGVTGRAATETFATIRAGAGTVAIDSGSNNSGPYNIREGSNYVAMRRAIYLFDTSSIPDTNTISAAVHAVDYVSGNSTNTGNQYLVTCASSPASNTALASSDYNVASWGTTNFGQSAELDAMTYPGYESVTMNASGLAAISKTGVTKLGVRCTDDFDNTEPGGTDGGSEVSANFSEKTGTGDDPYLQVTHAAPTFTPRAVVVM